jgi:23S rRNA pseudouridine1911/1915/1917 synthase
MGPELLTDKVIAPGAEFEFSIGTETAGTRLDNFIASQFAAYSRSFFKNLITDKLVTINQKIVERPGVTLKLGDQVLVKFPPAQTSKQVLIDQDSLGVQVLHTHPDFLVISKPAGLVVHAPQHDFAGVTLVDWILSKFQEIAQVGYAERPGIVHRLDLQTSGLMLVARNNFAQALLSDKFRARTMHKTYLAIVRGHPELQGIVDLAIARHPVQRNKMMVVKDLTEIRNRNARPAKTTYRVLKYLPDDLAVIEVKPETGRMHQIRVHMASLGHPVLGDTVYGSSSKLITRQALHAYAIGFEYCGTDYYFTCPIPDDLQKLIPVELLK